MTSKLTVRVLALAMLVTLVASFEHHGNHGIKRASWMDVKRAMAPSDFLESDSSPMDKKASWMDVKRASWMDVKKRASWMDVKKRASWMDVKKRASWMDV